MPEGISIVLERRLKMFSLFSKKAINSARSLSTVSADFPCAFKVITWPPGIKIKNDNSDVIGYKPLSALDAKLLRTQRIGKNVEALGHAIVDFSIDLKHPLLNSDFKNFILNFAERNGLNYTELERVGSYISWFPDSDGDNYAYTGNKIDFQSEAKKILGHDKAMLVFPENISWMNKSVSQFLGAEIKAINSDFSNDTDTYGQPDPERIIILPGDLDYQTVFFTLVNMMKSSQSADGKVLFLNETMPNATYFGADILRKYLKYFGDSKDPKFSELINNINPAHVCTTSVLQLMEAAIGEIKCREIAQTVIRENNLSQITAGLPLVDFTHFFAKAVVKEYLLTQSEKVTPMVGKF